MNESTRSRATILKHCALGVFLALGCDTSRATPHFSVEKSLERQIKNSRLTVSAFQCAIVAPSERESERLFNLGLTAGRDFFAFVKSNRSRIETELKAKIPMEWYLFTQEAEGPFSPSGDFVLGRIFASQIGEVNAKRTGTTTDLIKAQGAVIYQDRNCALLASD